MKHCWHHNDDRNSISYPPQHIHVCCFCGETVHTRVWHVRPGGHGPHIPKQEFLPEYPPQTECSKRSAPTQLGEPK